MGGLKYRKVEANNVGGLEERAEDLYVEASAVAATYNRVSRIGWRYVMLAGHGVERRDVAASMDHSACVEFHECGGDDERECCNTDLFRSRLG